MSRYVLSPAARADLKQIWDDNQAEKYVREIQRAIERVVGNPMIGRHAVGSHTLYYRIANADVIDVVRILHQRMDVDRHLD